MTANSPALHPISFFLVHTCSEKTGDNNPPESDDGFTPFHLAAQEGYTELCQFFFGNVDNKNPLSNIGLTLLHSASINGHVETYRFLMGHFEEKNPKDKNEGDTPLHLAAINGHYNLCQLILKYIHYEKCQKSKYFLIN